MISSLKISNFRGVREGSFNGFQPINILIGRNNCGKSTLLEALWIAGSAKPVNAIGFIARRRARRLGWNWIIHKANGVNECTVSIETTEAAKRSVRIQEPVETDRGANIPIEIVDQNKSVSSSLSFTDNDISEYSAENVYLPVPGVPEIRFVDPRNKGGGLQPIHTVFSQAVRLGKRDDIITFMKQVDPKLTGIEVEVEESDINKAPSVDLNFIYGDNYIPASLAGDGMQSLLRLSTELACRKRGVVLIEEPESFLHPYAIDKAVDIIFSAARSGIQLFIATHSMELVKAIGRLTDADPESANKAMVIKLVNRDGQIIPRSFPHDEIIGSIDWVNDEIAHP